MSGVTMTEPGGKPNVYFIDDSATMREVVKIAFRRENFNIVACSNVASAIAAFEETAPDAVISDVIMPDKDGYELCEFIKKHPRFGSTPVFLMSGVVNKEVAERAHQVNADELIRKPFHPQDLVARVRKLLDRAEPLPGPAPQQSDPAAPLTRLFERVANPFAPPPRPAPASATQQNTPSTSTGSRAPVPAAQEVHKLRFEVKRLECLVKKLQSDLASEREYSASLESQLQAVTAAE